MPRAKPQAGSKTVWRRGNTPARVANAKKLYGFTPDLAEARRRHKKINQNLAAFGQPPQPLPPIYRKGGKAPKSTPGKRPPNRVRIEDIDPNRLDMWGMPYYNRDERVRIQARQLSAKRKAEQELRKQEREMRKAATAAVRNPPRRNTPTKTNRPQSATTTAEPPPTQKRGRGRPPGSPNKVKKPNTPNTSAQSKPKKVKKPAATPNSVAQGNVTGQKDTRVTMQHQRDYADILVMRGMSMIAAINHIKGNPDEMQKWVNNHEARKAGDRLRQQTEQAARDASFQQSQKELARQGNKAPNADASSRLAQINAERAAKGLPPMVVKKY